MNETEEELRQKVKELEEVKKEVKQEVEESKAEKILDRVNHKISEVNQELMKIQEERKEVRRRQDLIRDIVSKVEPLVEEDHLMNTQQPSNLRFNKDGLRVINQYIGDLNKRIEQLLNKVDGEKKEAPKIEA